MTASTIVLMLAKVTVVIAIGLVAVRAARRSRASVRHALLAATFAGALVLPIVSLVTPPVSIAVPIAVAPVASAGDKLRVDAEAPPSNAPTDRPTSRVAAPPTAVFALSWSSVVLAIWIAGATVALLPLVAGLQQMRSLRRSTTPWRDGRSIIDTSASGAGISRRVDVLLHQSAPGPLTFGTLRPAILLPPDAATWSDADLHRAVVHELEHVRRGDWMTQCVSRVICATYWFHPLMWVAWRQFVIEAERACDDAVLGASDATDYADQLVALAARLSSGVQQPRLAMANRADLSTRVGAVLDRRQRRGRAGASRILAVATMAAALVIVVAPLRVVAAQTPQATAPQGQKLRYDAVTIKPCDVEEVPTGARGTAGGTNATFSPGRFSVPCVTTEQLIYLAYAAYGARDDQRLINDDPGSASNPIKIRGGPDWVHSLKEKYAIEATAVGATERVVLMGDMLQSLLEDRFKLKLHRESEQVDMLELKLAKGGLKLTPMKEGDCEPNPEDGSRVDPNAAKPRCGNLNMMNSNVGVRWTFGGFAMSGLAHQLSSYLKVHVIDLTGNTDKFVFRFEFQRDDQPGISDDRFESRTPAAGAGTVPGLPSLTAALDAIGLKLEKAKAPRGYLVIDHIERPKPDGPLIHVSVPARAAGPGTRRK